MEILICIGLFCPLASFLIAVALSGKISRALTGWLACGAVFISFLCFLSLLYLYTENGWSAQTVKLFRWIDFGPIKADFTLLLDPLSLVMTLIVSGVGFLIHVYSNGYMEDDESYPRFFAFLNFFIFAMLLLVLSENLLLLFAGWEGVGLASYLLIGFWFQKPAAAQAATKAFVINRIGDLGFLLGILLTFYIFGTSSITEVSEKVQRGFPTGAPLITLIGLLYFMGATGKSAQLPLHSWLPDAMEGPTPVSALIHAATMVTAGVYLVVRMHYLFILAPEILHLIGIIGGLTALFAALSALGQTDLKRVLAYSTLSQLGLMFVACGIGAFYAAIFHLTTHAFIKALLFLSAGNVLHMLHGTTEMSQMGGLWQKLPKTGFCFLIGVLALSGIPPLAAFFSKDLILEQEYLADEKVLFWIAFIASILTAVYMTRAFWLTFMGKPAPHQQNELHEAPPIMLVPIAILALLSFIGGVLGIAFGQFPELESFLGQIGITLAIREPGNSFLFSPETWISVFFGSLAVAATAFTYYRYAEKLAKPLAFLRKAFYLDEIYEMLIVNPLRILAKFLKNITEPWIFDGTIKCAVLGTQKAAMGLQKIQSGLIRSYVAWMLIGAVMLFILFMRG